MDTYFFFVESASSFVGKEFTHFFLSSPHAFVFGLRKVTLTQLSVAGMALLQAAPQGSPVLPVGKTELASMLLIEGEHGHTKLWQCLSSCRSVGQGSVRDAEAVGEIC